MIGLAAWYGFHMAPMQASSRALFAELIPPGQESAFFAFYELTNKGSSWLGPLVLSAVQQGTGSMAWGFLYVAGMTLGGCAGLLGLDVARGRQQAAAAGGEADTAALRPGGGEAEAS